MICDHSFRLLPLVFTSLSLKISQKNSPKQVNSQCLTYLFLIEAIYLLHQALHNLFN